MTGIIYNNNSYTVNSGSTNIEYSAMGGESIAYSTYGANIPYTEIDKDKLLNWIHLSKNTGDMVFSQLDYIWNSEHYVEVSFKRDNVSANMNLCFYEREATIPLISIRFTKITSNDIRFIYSQSSYSASYKYTPYVIGIYRGEFYNSNGSKITGSDVQYNGNYSSQICGGRAKLFTGGQGDRFEGKFIYFNVYTDASKNVLLHSYKPYLTTENEIVIKDEVTKKIFEIEGNTSIITYEIAQN